MTNYRFHVHKIAASWRLITRSDFGFPAGAKPEDWCFTRERAAEDTNPDVRNEVDAKGYCLFKIGGTFEDVAADMMRAR